jgi:hypothetical protein
MHMIYEILREDFICKSQVSCTSKFDIPSDNRLIRFDVHEVSFLPPLLVLAGSCAVLPCSSKEV